MSEGRERDWEVLSRHTEGRRTRFCEKGYEHQFDKLRARFPLHATLAYPIVPERLEAALSTVS